VVGPSVRDRQNCRGSWRLEWVYNSTPGKSIVQKPWTGSRPTGGCSKSKEEEEDYDDDGAVGDDDVICLELLLNNFDINFYRTRKLGYLLLSKKRQLKHVFQD
jgi:hypothetical protein